MRARARVCTGNLGCKLRRAWSAASLAEDSGSRDGVTRTTVSAGYSAGGEGTAAFSRVETVESARQAACGVGKGFPGPAAAAAPGHRNRPHSDGRQRMRFIVDVPAEEQLGVVEDFRGSWSSTNLSRER